MRPRLLLPLAVLLFLPLTCLSQGLITPRRPISSEANRTAAAAGEADRTTVAERSSKAGPLPGSLSVSALTIRVKIDGQVATVRAEQYFRNDTDETLEGTYYFPVPEGATLIEFAVWDGDQRRVGRVKEKAEARAAYAAAAAQGEDPAILEMTRRGWFQSRVYPIPPRADKRVEIVYSQLLQDKKGAITFDYPLGRGYKKLKVPVGDVSIEVDLRAEVAINNAFSPTHVMEIERDGDKHVSCKAQTTGGGDAENFQLSYALSSEEVSATLITYREKGEDGYFLLMLSPRVDFNEQRISAKDTVFVIDVSGSMAGDKMKQAREALRFGLTKTLNEEDSFNIIAFESKIRLFSPSLIKADRANLERALDFVEKLGSGGGTNINDALVAAMRLFAPNNRPHNIVFVTDGEASEGVTGENEIAANVKAANGARARLFSFGVGLDFNRLLLERLAAENRGVGANIDDEAQLGRIVSTFFSKVSKPVLSELRVDFGPVIADRVHPAELQDLYVQSRINIFGRYRNQEDLRDASVSLGGVMSGQSRRFEFNGLHFPLFTTDQGSLPKLWATERISVLLAEIRLHGEKPELKQEIIDLANRFNLVTPYTSMYVPTAAEAAREKERFVERDRSAGGSGSGPGDGAGSGSGPGTGPGSPHAQRVQGPNARPGAVVDQNGFAIAGATVKIKDEATGATRVVKTDESGNYSVAGLPPGKYRVEVNATGFQRTEMADVQIQPGQTRGAGVDLSAGGASESVTVVAAASVFNKSSTHLTIDTEKVEIGSLPNLSFVDSLARLAPGARPADGSPPRAESASPREPEFGIWIAGGRPRSNSFMNDGHNNTGIDGRPVVSLQTPEAVESLNVLTSRAAGDVSGSSASTINVISRAGTNDFHGSVFDYYINSKLGALSPLERRNGLEAPPRIRSDWFGGVFGGPIRRDRAFFFVSYAGESRSSNGFVDSTQSFVTPTLAGLGSLSTGFPASPTVRDLLERGPLAVGAGQPSVIPAYSVPVLGVPIEFGRATRHPESRSINQQAGTRLDFELSARDRFRGAYWYDSRSAPRSAARLAAGYEADQASRDQIGSGNWVRVISPRTINDLGLTFNKSHLELTPADGSPAGPAVSVGVGGLSYGRDPLGLSNQTSTVLEVADLLAYVAGRHSLKLGAQISRRVTSFDFLPGLGGNVSYLTFEDFVADRPAALAIAYGDARSRFAETRQHYYIDDAWQALADLTLTFGLSYELASQPINQLADRVRNRESNPATAMFDGSIPIETRTLPEVKGDWNNFSPRIGVAYSPSFRLFGRNLFGYEETVIRAGLSLSYDQTAYRPLADVAASSPNVLLGVLTPRGDISLPAFPSVPGADSLKLLFGGDPGNFARTRIAPDYRTPNSLNWHVGVTREFAGKVIFDANYLGSRGASLIRAIDGNPATPEAIVGTGGPLRVYESSGRSIYNGLQLRGSVRLRKLTGGISYAFGKLIDDVPFNNAGFSGGPSRPASLAAHSIQSFAQNPFDTFGGERALSNLDRRHSLAANFVWELPAPRFRSRILSALLGGWKTSGIAEIGSGFPFTPFQYFGLTGSVASFASIFSDRFGGLRPFAGNPLAPADAVAFSNAANAHLRLFMNPDGSPFMSPTGFIIADRSGFHSGGVSSARLVYNDYIVEQALIARGLVPDAFGRTFANGRPFGDAGRNSLRGGSLANFDLAIAKMTRLTERVSLEIRGEMFNAFNHPSRGTPDAIVERAGGRGFADPGEVDATPRRVRIALKLHF